MAAALLLASAPLAWCPEPNPEELALPEEVDAVEPPAPRPLLPCNPQPRHLLVRVRAAARACKRAAGSRTAGRNAPALCAPQVLDVNGLLIERSITVLRNAQDEPVEPDMRVGAFHVYNRPGLQAFITMLMERFVVGVWSSARQHNLRGLVRHIFGAYEERLAFAWGQESCTYAGTTADNKPLFLKELGRVWAEPAFASFGPHNTLLVDDDAYKAARNPPNTAIHPKKVRRPRPRRLLACARPLGY